ncbi:hypothetical protein ACVJGD_008434 [Bradyrhizobium sp. USDA 10063]
MPNNEVLTQHGRTVTIERQHDVITQLVIYEFPMPICR